MVDSVKNYGITGVAGTVELGKQGPKIVDSGSEVELKDNTGNSVINAEIAQATASDDAITYDQLLSAGTTRIVITSQSVDYNSGNVFLGTLPANSTVLSVTVEPSSSWTGIDSNTEITVGDTSNNSRLYSGFADSDQTVSETNHVYTSETELFAYVSQGGATAGGATVSILHTGTTSQNRTTVSLEYLLVGGGGGGGTGYDNAGGGGGGAGMALAGSITANKGTSYNITIGSGGAGGPDTRTNTGGSAGSSTTALGLTALGGGAGLGSRVGGTPGQAQVGNSTAPTGGAGSGGGKDGKGGGGATGAGTGDGSSPGSGGAGLVSNITGTNVTYSTGGAGGYNGGPYDGANGANNTGNGGAGGSSPSFNSAGGGDGGSGVVILRHLATEDAATTTGSVTVTTASGYRIYTFTGDGTIEF